MCSKGTEGWGGGAGGLNPSWWGRITVMKGIGIAWGVGDVVG